MSRDYKTTRKTSGGRSGSGSLMLGILIGLLLGLSLALGIAWYINKLPNPFVNRPNPPQKAEAVPPPPAEKAKSAETKPRFDFYKILPGSEEPAAEAPRKESPPKESTAKGKGTFFLQVGSFQNAPDADNLKARLALLGLEASVQTTTVPDKGVWHRVRVGPYSAIEELNRARDTLKQNSIDSSLVRVPDAPAGK
jgi:cell division protein FtsN